MCSDFAPRTGRATDLFKSEAIEYKSQSSERSESGFQNDNFRFDVKKDKHGVLSDTVLTSN